MYLYKRFDCGCVYRLIPKGLDTPRDLTIEACCESCWDSQEVVKQFNQYHNMLHKKARLEEFLKEGFVKGPAFEAEESLQKRATIMMDILNAL